MAIKDIFETTSPREFAGQDTFRDYRFQTYFAANLLLRLAENNDNSGIVLLDYFDDVVLIDNDQMPTFITFYQVKTNRECKISISTIINKSFLEKMAWNMEQFKQNNCSAVFATNGDIFFNFSSTKTEALKIKGYDNFNFSSLDQISITKVIETKQMSQQAIEKLKSFLPEGVQLDDIFLLKTDFSLDDYENVFLGKITRYFSSIASHLEAVDVQAITDSLIERMSEKQGSPHSTISLTFEEIKRKKGVMVQDLNDIVKSVSSRTVPVKFDSLYTFARDSLGYNFENKNILELSQRYCSFKVDYVKNDSVVDEIYAFLKAIDISSFTNDELFEKIDNMLKESEIYSKYQFCKAYHNIMVVLYIFKQMEGIEV